MAIQQRYILTIMLFFAMMVATALRTAMSMAILGMVPTPHNEVVEKPSSELYCLPPDWALNITENVTSSQKPVIGVRYDWSQKEQGMILSSFYVGYILTHIPGGLMAQRFGGKYVIGLGLSIAALLSMAIPVACQYGGVNALIAIRVLMGVFQGPMMPSFAQLLSAWVPTVERAFLGTIAYAGMVVGIIVATYFSGFIMFYYSWELVFYVFGSVTIVWFLIFILVCFNNPASHPFISNAEKNYLLKELGQLERDNQHRTPWKDILSNKAVLALIVAWVFADWAYYVVSVTLPKYMNDVLNFSIVNIGTLNAIPWITRSLLACMFGYVIDRLIAHGKISVTVARKSAVLLASIFPAVFLILASYAECNHMLVVIFFIVSIGMRAFLTAGLYINPMDLSSNYSGTIMSLANGAGALTGIMAPYTVGLLTPNAYLSEWRLVFWISFCVYIFESLTFVTWGSGKVQPFDSTKIKERNTELIEKTI